MRAKPLSGRDSPAPVLRTGIGERVLRLEDESLLTGRATFIDDIRPEGFLEIAFVRSPEAHGRIVDAGVADLPALTGVEAIFAADDLDVRPLTPPNTNPDVQPPPQPVLAAGSVRFVGEPIAAVVATGRYRAEDARDLAAPLIEPLRPLVDPRQAAAEGAEQIHQGRSNTVVDVRRDEGDVEGAFAAADVVVERTFRTPRQSALPIEGRGVVAVPAGGGVTVWTSSQLPHKVREAISECLDLDPGRIRVVTPDIGGGFGVKAHVYPEEVVLAALALRLGKPVRWIEDRMENLAASTQARNQELEVRAAMSADGELLAIDVDMLCDQGAYGAYPHGVSLEAMTTSGMLPGPYRLGNYRVRARTVVTNKSPQGAYRGVGFVVAAFVHERLIDLLARTAGMDPAEVRRRNLIRESELPFVSVTGQPYDSGDYGRALGAALDRIGYGEIDAEKQAVAKSGRRLGVGLASYVEPTGMNSHVFKMRGMVGIAGMDAAHVAVEEEGLVRVWTTTPAIGQGSVTTMAQLAAEALGIELDRVRVEHSDTAAAELQGTGTFASRSAVSAGGAVAAAASSVRERLIESAADRLEAAERDLVIADGAVRVAGSEQAAVAIRELVESDPERYRVSRDFDPPQTVYPYATHACLVSVDVGTGQVSVERYVVAEDCGRIINPMIVEGQVHGAVAQGVGGALFEAHDYDDAGQLRTASLLDYVIPGATELPALELLHLELPSPVTASGVKGVGEGGTIGAPAAVVNAISDALGEEFNSFPVTPEQIIAVARR